MTKAQFEKALKKRNKDRSDRAAAALNAYLVKTYSFGKTEFTQDDLNDLICDLLHLADRMGLDPEGVLEEALTNYRCEVEPDDIEQASIETEEMH